MSEKQTNFRYFNEMKSCSKEFLCNDLIKDLILDETISDVFKQLFLLETRVLEISLFVQNAYVITPREIRSSNAKIAFISSAYQ